MAIRWNRHSKPLVATLVLVVFGLVVYFGGRLGTGSTLGYKKCEDRQTGYGILFETNSPIGISVTDPEGYTITPQTLIVTEREYLTEVPGQLYMSVVDKDNSSLPIRTVYGPLKEGAYKIQVAPLNEDTTSSTRRFTLDVITADNCIRVAENALFTEVPQEGYLIDP